MTAPTRPSGNLLADLPNAAGGEVLEILLARDGLRIERIVSHDPATAAGEWYDQDDDEWVVVLQGAARIEIEGEAAPRSLTPGDFVYLPAHCRHRVTWTTLDTPTVWLAVHAAPEPPAPTPSS